jgi:hypothetical protein
MMSLLFILLVPVIAIMVARWSWRQHLLALRVLRPSLANETGVSTPPKTATVVSVLVIDDTVLVGLRPAPTRRAQVMMAGLPAPVSTLLLSLDGNGCSSVARLERWQASEAPVLLWADGHANAIELCQLHTGQTVRLPLIGEAADRGLIQKVTHRSRRHTEIG